MTYGELDDCIDDFREPDDSVYWYLESTEAHEECEFYEALAQQERE